MIKLNYFTSDTHFAHYNIMKYHNRPFSSTNEMDSVLIGNINNTVGVNDTLYFLGDLGMHLSIEEARKYVSRINCKNIMFVKGNHDKNYADAKIFRDFCIYKEIYFKHDFKQKVVLCHYPFLSWNGSCNRSINLHGHQHNNKNYNLENIANGILRFDVGVDANDYMPVSEKTIINWSNRALKNYQMQK